MVLDNKKIERKLFYLKDNLELFEKNLDLYEEEKDKIKKLIYKNALSKVIEEIVETAIKINSIFLKEKNIFIHTYYQSFSKLSEEYNLDENLFEELAQTTSFRNNLVHNYINSKTQNLLENNIFKLKKLYLKYIKEIQKILN